MNPYLKELDSSIWASIRNRNQYLDLLPFVGGQTLPKSDILNGQPLNDWNFFQRGFNEISPVQINIAKPSPGKELLYNSNYDLNSTTMSYNGYDFSDNARVRALFQNAMGNASITLRGITYKNLEDALTKLSKDPAVIASLAQMEADSNNPHRNNNNPNVSYYHNDMIHRLFKQARESAWNAIRNNPEVLELIKVQDDVDRQQRLSRYQTDPSNELLQLNNP